MAVLVASPGPLGAIPVQAHPRWPASVFLLLFALLACSPAAANELALLIPRVNVVFVAASDPADVRAHLFTGQTDLTLGRTEAFERYVGLGYDKLATTLDFSTEWLKWLAIAATISVGTEINFDAAPGLTAFPEDAQDADLTDVNPQQPECAYLRDTITLRPTSSRTHSCAGVDRCSRHRARCRD